MNEVTLSIFSLALIFAATTLGAAMVYFFKKGLSEKTSSIILGGAGGIMISASIFGLILPSIEKSNELYSNKYLAALPVIGGFLIGCLFMTLLDKVVPHFHMDRHEEEGLSNEKLTQSTKFFLAVTMHNIPEGLSVGFACGIALADHSSASMAGALALAIGIAIQNFPEGAAVSIPMLDVGYSKNKSFLFGMFSGIVEPIAGIIGLFLAQYLVSTVPWLLSLTAGAMFYVTLDELIPTSIQGKHSHYGLWSFLIGFLIMLALEILL